MSKRVIISISSDIGTALAEEWMGKGHDVLGTYRTPSEATDTLAGSGATLFHNDLADAGSVDEVCAQLQTAARDWETLVLAPGLQDPIGMFADCDFGEWASSMDVNFTAQMRILHALLLLRNRSSQEMPSVVMFAGGGTNNATVRYSAYTIAKIASIKICELLDAEIPDCKFTIIGPGWVKTKIHESTLDAKESAGNGYERTIEKLNSDECVPMDQVVKCVDWVIGESRDVVGGRNISLVYDDWGNPELNRALRDDNDMYKLRRSGNDKLVRSVPISERGVGS